MRERTKHQIPNTKPQRNPRRQISMTAVRSVYWSLGFGASLEFGVWCFHSDGWSFHSFQPDPRIGIVGGHVGENHLVAHVQAIQYYNGAHRGAAQFYGHAHG